MTNTGSHMIDTLLNLPWGAITVLAMAFCFFLQVRDLKKLIDMQEYMIKEQSILIKMLEEQIKIRSNKQ